MLARVRRLLEINDLHPQLTAEAHIGVTGY